MEVGGRGWGAGEGVMVMEQTIGFWLGLEVYR